MLHFYVNDNLLTLLRDIIRFKSVTPMGENCLLYIKTYLEKYEFDVHILKYGSVSNLYAKKKHKNDYNLCFVGHVDVVPSGANWTYDPFDLTIEGEKIYGRGIVDMKGAIAAFLHAISVTNISSTVSILLTTDEEAEAKEGIVKCVPWLKEQGEKFDLFVIGEPTANIYAGDAVKVGRRGSVTFVVDIIGEQGHIAYPQFANNPLNVVADLMHELHDKTIGDECENFEKSRIQFTSIDTNNFVENLLPKKITLRFGVRFNASLFGNDVIQLIENKLKEMCDKYLLKFTIRANKNGEPFHMNDQKIISWLKNEIQFVTNQNVNFNADGAISDGRFLHHLAPVVEIGLEESQAHRVNEHSTKSNLIQLFKIYQNLLKNVNLLQS